MLYFVSVWIVLLTIGYLLGIGLLNVCQSTAFTRVGDRLIIAVWLGTIVLAIALLAVSLMLPLSPLIGAIVAGSLCGISLLLKRTRIELLALRQRVSGTTLLGFLTLMLAIAALTTGAVTWQDTGYYHYQVIQWLAKFGAVPGIALLFPNFGFTSSWFAFAAPLNAEVFASRVSAVTNGFVLLIATLQCVLCLRHCLKREAYLSDWFMVACSLMLLPIVLLVKPLASILVSPSPDIPVIFLTEVIAWAILVLSTSRLSTSRKDAAAINGRTIAPEVIPFFLSAGAVTVKLTALPILGISSLFLLSRGFSPRRIAIASIVFTLLIAPMLASGVVTSGCPLFPSPWLCFDLPWSPTQEAAKNIAKGAYGLTNWVTSPPSGIPPWLWSLWGWFSVSSKRQLMAVLLLCSIAPAVYITKKIVINRFYEQLWVILIALSGIIFITLQSPFFRFAVPYLVLLPALGIAVYVQNNFEGTFYKIVDRLNAQFAVKKLFQRRSLLCLSLIAVIVTSSASSAPFSRLLLPPPIQKIPFVKKRVNDIAYFSPTKDESCWATQLPCTIDVPPNVKLRHALEGIAGGFVRSRR